MSPPRVFAVTLGDPAGVGPEVAVKTLADGQVRRQARWVVVGRERDLREGMGVAGETLRYSRVRSVDEVPAQPGSIALLEAGADIADAYPVGRASAGAGRVAAAALRDAIDLASAGQLGGVVYAPLCKEALHGSGLDFIDELHLFASWLGRRDGFSEVNVLDDLWLFRVTSHVPLAAVVGEITAARVLERILFARDTLRKVGVADPSIAVAALNPHAGEGGLLGTEEQRQIKPAIEQARARGVNAHGPYPGDTVFVRYRTSRFDALLAMYHDQGQTGAKLMGFNRGVTIAGGLPVILTTPAHGTAFDIAGRGTADPGAMKEAIRVALRLSQAHPAPPATDAGHEALAARSISTQVEEAQWNS